MLVWSEVPCGNSDTSQSNTELHDKVGLAYISVKVKVNLSLCLTKHHAMKKYPVLN